MTSVTEILADFLLRPALSPITNLRFQKWKSLRHSLTTNIFLLLCYVLRCRICSVLLLWVYIPHQASWKISLANQRSRVRFPPWSGWFFSLPGVGYTLRVTTHYIQIFIYYEQISATSLQPSTGNWVCMYCNKYIPIEGCRRVAVSSYNYV